MDSPPNDANEIKAPVLHRIVLPRGAYYAVQEPTAKFDTPPALLIAIHGYGQSAKKFIRQFASMRNENILVVAPQAPNAFYWNKTGSIVFGWLTSFDRDLAVRELLAFLNAVYEEVREKHPIDPERVFVLGFSQGAALALRAAAAEVAPFRGVISCGADLPPDVAEQLPEINPLPALVVHGKQDEVMTFDKGEDAANALEAHGFPVTRHFFEGGHSLDPDVIATIVDWMQSQR